MTPALPRAKLSYMDNVLFLINHAGKAGTERYVRTLAEGAQKHGFRPFFAYNEPGPLLEQMRLAGAGCFNVVMRGPFDLRAAGKLADICEDLRINVVHTNYLRENYIAILAKLTRDRGLKVVYTNHFVTPAGAFVKLANFFMTRADHKIISVCDAGVRNLIKNGCARKKIIVVRNAVNPDAWRPGPDYGGVRAQARLEYGIGEGDKMFFCASRFAHDKGHKFLLESLAWLAARHGDQNLRVVLAGDGPLDAEIRAGAEAAGLSGIIQFIGYVKDIKPLFYAADAYLNPSEHEASSFLILEALASGLPVIAADKGGNREIVNEANGCGALVRYGDIEGYASAIQAFRTDSALLARASENALKTVERDFALDDMLEKTYASFY